MVGMTRASDKIRTACQPTAPEQHERSHLGGHFEVRWACCVSRATGKDSPKRTATGIDDAREERPTRRAAACPPRFSTLRRIVAEDLPAGGALTPRHEGSMAVFPPSCRDFPGSMAAGWLVAGRCVDSDTAATGPGCEFRQVRVLATAGQQSSQQSVIEPADQFDVPLREVVEGAVAQIEIAGCGAGWFVAAASKCVGELGGIFLTDPTSLVLGRSHQRGPDRTGPVGGHRIGKESGQQAIGARRDRDGDFVSGPAVMLGGPARTGSGLPGRPGVTGGEQAGVREPVQVVGRECAADPSGLGRFVTTNRMVLACDVLVQPAPDGIGKFGQDEASVGFVPILSVHTPTLSPMSLDKAWADRGI